MNPYPTAAQEQAEERRDIAAERIFAVNERAAKACAEAFTALSAIVDDHTPSLVEGFWWDEVLEMLRVCSKLKPDAATLAYDHAEEV